MIKLTDLSMANAILFDNRYFVLNEKDLGYADISLSTFKGYNQIGMKITNRTVEKRDIHLVGFILADNDKDMLSRKRDLQRIVSPFEDFFLVIGDYKIRVAANATIQYAVPFYENNKFLAKFIIEGTCADPCFTTIGESATSLAHWTGGFHFPLHMSVDHPVVMGVRQKSMIKMVANNGEIDTGLKFRLKAKAAIKDPFIINLLTQEKLQLHCNLLAGDEVLINTNYGEKSIVKNGNEDFFYTLDLNSDFLQLHVGENYFRYGAATNDDQLEIDAIYSPKFLEV